MTKGAFPAKAIKPFNLMEHHIKRETNFTELFAATDANAKSFFASIDSNVPMLYSSVCCQVRSSEFQPALGRI